MIAAREWDLESCASAAQDEATRLVRDNPAMSMMVVFGLGVAIGAILGEVIACSTRSESTAQRLGRQFYDAMPFRS